VTDAKYIGLDVHQATISAAVLDSTGKLVMESILETKAATILQFVHGLRGGLHVAFEEGTCAAWLHDLLQPHVTKVLVCDPRLCPLGQPEKAIGEQSLIEPWLVAYNHPACPCQKPNGVAHAVVLVACFQQGVLSLMPLGETRAWAPSLSSKPWKVGFSETGPKPQIPTFRKSRFSGVENKLV
jgi:hypothetical protein